MIIMRRAFTLVELLVVVAMIAVLLAMLMPALDQAVYQAQLTVCSAHQKSIGQAAINYTLDHRRFYPYRSAVDQPDSYWSPCKLYHRPGNLGPHDDRPEFRPYMDLNKLLNDPLVTPVDFEDNDDLTSDVVSSVMMWFGFRYEGQKGMHRIGDRWTHGGRSFDILVGDRDLAGNGSATGEATEAAFYLFDGEQCSHPDKAGVLYNTAYQSTKHPWGVTNVTFSFWMDLLSASRRGPVDTNYGYQDLSVHRFRDVPWNATTKAGGRRMVFVADFSQDAARFQHVPPN